MNISRVHKKEKTVETTNIEHTVTVLLKKTNEEQKQVLRTLVKLPLESICKPPLKPY